MEELRMNVNGMVCDGCEKRIVNAVGQIDGVEEVIANHNNGTVIVKSNKVISKDEVKERIEDIGFEVKED